MLARIHYSPPTPLLQINSTLSSSMTGLSTCRFIRLVANRAGISASEKLALMVAALCHDMDHPGKRNSPCCCPETQPLHTHLYMGSEVQACGEMQ